MIKRILLSLILWVGVVFSAFANGTLVNGIYYTFSGSNATVTYTGGYGSATTTYTGDIVIPSSFTHEAVEYTVVAIDNYAFYNGTSISSVSIPSSITSIGNYAFQGCTGISSITIPSAVTSIGSNAFKSCTGLTSVTFNAINVTSAPTSTGSAVFNSATCTNPCTLTIGSGVTQIPNYMFYGLSNVSIINFNATSCADFTNGTYSYAMPTIASGCTLNIGNNVTKIPAYAFRGKNNLTSINMGNSVETIGEYAFYGCTNTGLTDEITLPETLTTVGQYAFYNCYYPSFYWPSNITSIGTYAFYYCQHLATAIINDAITEIPASAFQGCTGLKTLTIGTGVKTIGNSAFSGCTGLTNITLNATLTTVPTSSSYYAFKNCTCTDVCTLTIGTGVTAIPNNTFANLANIGTIYFNATSCADFESSNTQMPAIAEGCSLIIGDNVTKVPAYLLVSKPNLQHIIIGSSVTTIGARALYAYNSALTDIISKPTTPPTLASDTYYSGTKTYPVYVPFESKSAYEAANYWNVFTNFKEYFEFTGPYSIGGELISDGYSILLSGAGSITIENTGIVICDNILGTTPENLIIEDGGKLIVYGSGIQATIEKEVKQAANWGTGTTYDADQWYFIASPVNGAAFPTGSVATQDIYQLDWANNKWLNLQNSDNSSLLDAGFQRGTGYLYASKEDNTISVAGEIQSLSGSNDATVTLATTGWNLIGNPLTCKVTVDKAFSELNNASSVTNKAASSTIDPFQGIAVYGNAGDVVTFTKAASQDAVAPSNNNSLQMTLSKEVATRGTVSSKVVDNAIVRFEDNGSLPKFSMLESDAKLFIPQNGEEYAIAFSNRQGEMPLNFKAKELGTYTINFDGTDLKNIKLIDKIENSVINLNESNSYTFIGSPSDRIERFVIRFENSESFAYQNGCDIIVSGEGELQIFDVMGRIVAKQYVSGVETINVKANGVYIFRLNGMTQKSVVK